MNPGHEIWVLLVGLAVTLAAPLQALAARLRIPSLVGYLPLGLALRAADDRWQLLGDTGRTAFGLLADLGIVVLLFHVGLRSNLAGLARKLKPAALIWMGDVGIATLAAYAVARHGLGLPLAASLTIAVALSATSVSVAAAVWDEAGALQTAQGEMLIDVAELDDISGVLLLGLLMAVAPILVGGGTALAPLLLAGAAVFVLKFGAFAAACALLAKHVEPRLTHAIARLERAPQRMLTVVGAGFVIAAVAGAAGFSLAIGALFAGLVFSRDPAAVKTEARLDDLYVFLVPFFFIGVGLQIEPAALGQGLGVGAWLLAAAVAGKLVGAGLPAFFIVGPRRAALLATSLVPRAEIALVIAQQGLAAGLLSRSVHAGLVLVSALTCLLTPWAIHALLARWPRAVGAPRRAPAGGSR